VNIITKVLNYNIIILLLLMQIIIIIYLDIYYSMGCYRHTEQLHTVVVVLQGSHDQYHGQNFPHTSQQSLMNKIESDNILFIIINKLGTTHNTFNKSLHVQYACMCIYLYFNYYQRPEKQSN